MDVLLLIIALVIILIGAELFTNGIEWFGHHLDLAEGAVGSVLAAVGTALPETMIPIVAIIFATGHAQETAEAVGVGAILGAPFMLATLAMFVTGTAVLLLRRRRPTGTGLALDTRVLGTDVRYFFVAYGLAVGAAFLPSDAGLLRLGVAGLLVLVYVIYVRAHLAAETGIDAGSLAPLRLHRLDLRHWRALPQRPRLRIVNTQVVAALLLIIGGAVAFVEGVEGLATGLGVSPTILALVIAPIATELPEKFNSILWVRHGKDTLAMGNITGAMVFQSCIPTIVGLMLAAETWRLDVSSPESVLAFSSAAIAFISTVAIFLPMVLRGRLTGAGLLVGGVFYLAYLALVMVVLA